LQSGLANSNHLARILLYFNSNLKEERKVYIKYNKNVFLARSRL